ncbi:MAG: ATP-dependent DNA helicase [Alphaproteobacteria bacterium]|nr:ATP-dependent DNA helicase [Alphaproteobacteria bacterium]
MAAEPAAPSSAARLLLPDAPSLALGLTQAAWLSSDGEIAIIDLAEAARRVRRTAPLLCHARAVARRLQCGTFAAFDLLELFAFIRPARFCLPTPRGLAATLALASPRSLEDEALSLAESARALLGELADGAAGDPDAAVIAAAMERGGWGWGPSVRAALGARDAGTGAAPAGLAAWRRLSEWAEHAPEAPPGNEAIEPAEARRRLAELLGAHAEARPQQGDYADAVSQAFAPRGAPRQPCAVLAEAGTGVGKTLGYIAPSSVWAEKNGGAVWISTYTRNLQHQIDGELDRLYPDASVKARRVVLRKGRENYLCLLNFEEAVAALPMRPADAVPLGLIARWLARTRDGDIVGGGDLPGWLSDVLGRGRSLGLTDRRGECIHSACAHYHRCFIERSVRKARRARIVVANHALVMVQAALGGLDDGFLPTRYVFDEGHHVFDAADSAFSLTLPGEETADLRRWLLGVEAGGRGRARGLRRRLDDLIAGDGEAEAAMAAALLAARALPGEGWQHRLAEGRPMQAAESFLAILRRQVLARAPGRDGGYGIETEARPPVEGLLPAAAALETALARVETPLTIIARILADRLEDDAADLDTGTRQRIEAMIRSLTRRGTVQVGGWRRMLRELALPQPPEFIDWISLERRDGLEYDVGMHRHWVDPSRPFIEAVAKPAHGFIVTSATLTDGSTDPVEAWAGAEARTGARHLEKPAWRARVPSPFDYQAQTRVFIVTDIRRDDVGQVAGAYRALFLAAAGGALGLFTAIARLKAVHQRIAAPLEDAGLMLLAQHVDGMDTGTLVDIFRAEEDSCLLGTDAVRDGVDVPGRSLRLIVFDRVPWPRPDMLHKARRAAFGGARYDDMLTRLRLKQAYGRLVRRATDTGVFVLLDPALPSRLLGAFPEKVAIERIGLKEAVARTAAFLKAS